MMTNFHSSARDIVQLSTSRNLPSVLLSLQRFARFWNGKLFKVWKRIVVTSKHNSNIKSESHDAWMSKKLLRLPGVEPGSIAWKAIILTVGLQTPAVFSYTYKLFKH